jgi:alpha-galactosidase/6-phospho-beta-glucosidase family protein
VCKNGKFLNMHLFADSLCFPPVSQKAVAPSEVVAKLTAAVAHAMDQLTPRQRIYIDALFSGETRNAWQAAELAGYAHPRSQGPRLRTMPNVAKAHQLRLDLLRAQWDEERQDRERQDWRQEIAKPPVGLRRRRQRFHTG